MINFKTFRGGVHPPHMKITAATATREIPIPALLTVYMQQHIGAPSIPQVQKGDLVKKGQLIGAIPEGKLGANIHAPTSGKVIEVALKAHPNGKNINAIVIEPDGQDTWDESIVPCENPLEKSKEELLAQVKAAGIVGMGGATFPAHVKLAPPAGTKINVLIINGAECEPALTSDHRLMLEKSKETALGIQLLSRILDNPRTILLVEDNKKDAAAAMEEVCKPLGIEVALVKAKYPQGAEKQLVKVVTGSEIAPRQLPSSVGAVIQNVASAFAVYEACYLGRPLIRRITTVTGTAINQPANLWTLIGTPMDFVLAQCGGLKDNTAMLIHGGPMMGATLSSTAVSTTKGSGGLLALSNKEIKPATFGPCIHCGRCVAACPQGQVPFEIALALEQKKYDLDLINDFVDHDFDCVECGSCAYSCPSRRPLVEFIRQAKALSAARRQKR